VFPFQSNHCSATELLWLLLLGVNDVCYPFVFMPKSFCYQRYVELRRKIELLYQQLHQQIRIGFNNYTNTYAHKKLQKHFTLRIFIISWQ